MTDLQSLERVSCLVCLFCVLTMGRRLHEAQSVLNADSRGRSQRPAGLTISWKSRLATHVTASCLPAQTRTWRTRLLRRLQSTRTKGMTEATGTSQHSLNSSGTVGWSQRSRALRKVHAGTSDPYAAHTHASETPPRRPSQFPVTFLVRGCAGLRPHRVGGGVLPPGSKALPSSSPVHTVGVNLHVCQALPRPLGHAALSRCKPVWALSQHGLPTH